MKMFLLPENVRMGLLQYLEQRPYAEVCNVMTVLWQLHEHQDQVLDLQKPDGEAA
jgi:hypothetical protein